MRPKNDRPKLLVATLAVVLWVPACSLAWDFDAYQDGECDDGFKACDEECVPTNRANLGCSREGCAPCIMPHAVAICSPDGSCAIGTCQDHYRDCDASEPGCETDTDHDPDHCGDCATSCDEVPNALRGCTAGFCAVAGCDPGYRDCNNKYKDGCEIDLMSDSANCGDCNAPCDGNQTCQDGHCV
ncbi:MAG: hypothetical protein U0271_03740 [Polyangiaceae bacterium]